MSERARNLARRTVWGVVIAAVLGCVTSVLLVWVLAFTRPGPPGKDYESFSPEEGAVRSAMALATLENAWCTAHYLDFSGAMIPDRDEATRQYVEGLRRVLPEKYQRLTVVREVLRSGRVSDGGLAWEYRWGWPRKCVVATWGSLDRVGNPPPWDWRGAIHFKTPVLSAWRGMDNVLLAYRPLPLGLATNTAVYGLGWFVALVAGAAARRALRRRRGRCPMCAYDLGGDLGKGCSECGWRREGKAPKHEGTDSRERAEQEIDADATERAGEGVGGVDGAG